MYYWVAKYYRTSTYNSTPRTVVLVRSERTYVFLSTPLDLAFFPLNDPSPFPSGFHALPAGLDNYVAEVTEW